MKRAFTIWQLLLLLAVLCILAAIIFPIIARERENEHPPNGICMSNLKNIGLGFQQYLQDYNEKFPVVTSGGSVFGWADALQPYMKSTQVFQCPLEQTGQSPDPAPSSAGYTDYWMNARLSGRSQSLLASTSLTILNGDGNDGTDVTDARYAIHSIPEAWKKNANSPLNRFVEGANYGFADGHVKWIQADKMAAMKPNAATTSGNTSFALK